MAIRVWVGEKAWKGFLRRAKKAFPKEHIEALWGTETIDSYRVTDFKNIRITKSTSSSIEYDDNELKRHKWLAQKSGKAFLGTVHTHPRASDDTAPSKLDHHDGAKEEKIMGVVVLYKKKESERFVVEHDWWIPQPKIEFELLPE